VKHDAILINTSRGELIDEKYLIKHLKEGRFKSVGLDVFENEPDVNPELLNFPNLWNYRSGEDWNCGITQS